jgi:hypothetical protein
LSHVQNCISYFDCTSTNCCSKRPQKRAPSNAAFHPTIETVGFQAALSVIIEV